VTDGRRARTRGDHVVVVERSEVAIPKVRGADGDTDLCPQRLVSGIGAVHHLCCCIAINNIIFINNVIFVIFIINPCLLLTQASCGCAFQTFGVTNHG
jgi:hypothetical protein